jgi:hypothetical protein
VSRRDEDGPGDEGRSRRVRSIALGIIGVVAVGALSLSSSLRGSDAETPTRTPIASGATSGRGISAPALYGRLVYAATVPDGQPGLRERLVAYDLETGAVTLGPRIPTASSIVRVDPDTVVVIADVEGGEREAYLVRSVTEDAKARPIARGEIVEPSADGQYLLVVERVRDRHCPGDGYEARTEVLTLDAPFDTPPTRVQAGCGDVVSGALSGTRVALTVVGRDGVARVLSVPGLTTFRRPVPVDVGKPGLSVVGIGPTGTTLYVRSGTSASPSLPPVGPLLVKRLHDPLTPVVDGFVATRVLAWRFGGGIVAVNGSLDGTRAMWLLNLATGDAASLLPSSGFDLGTAFSGAAFDVSGNAYGASAGAIVASSPLGTFPIPLPSSAPTPQGPLAWLH